MYKIDKLDSFRLKDIFECGQCFRWEKEIDNSYTGVVYDRVINVKIENEVVIFTSSNDDNLKPIVRSYFDLDRNYSEIKDSLSKIDKYMKTSIEFGKGIRILNQDLWECIISFIISANNNIPRIKKIIEKLSKEYGKEIEFNGKKYYTFPTPKELGKASVQDLRNLGLGFRDKRVYETTRKVNTNEVDLDEIKKLNNSNKIREELLKLDGVGNKVADCIMLFSLQRFDVFPIDVWVRRVMHDLYIHNENEENVSKTELGKIAEEKFGKIAGLAQQYLFYWRRENDI